jgi:CRISPR-associated endonuclease/helicase Cas3
MSERFLDFWGKARPARDDTEAWHPLICHSLDVAAVAKVLLTRHPALAASVAHNLRCPFDDFVDTFVFLIALHDIGKFSRPFQAKAPEHWPSLLGPYQNVAGDRHDAVGLALLLDDQNLQVFAVLDRILPAWSDTQIKAILYAIAGHHGSPAKEIIALQAHIVCEKCQNEAGSFVTALAALMTPRPLPSPRPKDAETLSWWLAGLTTLCDWIGSTTSWFPYAGGVSDLAAYWHLAMCRADIAVTESGMMPAEPAGELGLAALKPSIKMPTAIQRLAEGMSLPDGPVCVVIEDATGGGKTEAALLLAQRLIADRRADGLFIALPTMATADAMFDRLAESYRRLFASKAQPSLALAHGRAALHDLFQGSILAKATDAEDELDDGAPTASSQCAAWLADDRRRVFFAHVGVGTIDQAFLAVLAARHAPLRLFGLSRKVLVVDEAHAYDPYMAEELDRLLMFHAMLGGSSIILSATLPLDRRAGLLKAFAAGLQAPPVIPQATDYPLMTIAGAAAGVEHHAEMRAALRRDLPVRRLDGMSEAVDALVAAARAGACGIWVRNTVDDARAADLALREAGIEPTLFHARFAMGDRLAIQKNVLAWFGKVSTAEDRAPGGLGRVLVATQVVEQSLDLDADVMVTDLAPIELLIQRAGRLRRHPQRTRPAGLSAAELWVVSPPPVSEPGKAWAADPEIGGTQFVYEPHILWRSARVMFAAGKISVPDGVRSLVEAVYGDDSEALPAALQPLAEKADGEGHAQRGHARGNLLRPEMGYHARNGRWESDVAMPTRLGDDYTIFRIARVQQGRLVPWCDDADEAKAWALSEIALRKSIADGAEVPAHRDAEAEKLRKGWKLWQRETPLFVMETPSGSDWSFNARRGERQVRLLYSRTGGCRLDGGKM